MTRHAFDNKDFYIQRSRKVIFIYWKGQRERYSPLPKITHPTCPIWESAEVSPPRCNGKSLALESPPS